MTLVTSVVNAHFTYDSPVRKNSLRDTVTANVIRLLREERKKRGLSMNVVAQRSGLSHSIVSLIERDLRNPTLDTLLRIAEAIGIDLGEVITRAGKLAARQRRQ
ncbi:MAG TPA: helix-turn-helix transcriptional regulator [Verrucomicrobiae bacterium]|nr:helix-turn-helix transcriptional regulator [Verrucomicrobiae bacterium]